MKIPQPPKRQFPAEFVQQENKLIEDRRKKACSPEDGPTIGLALSGGGIRSATFSLGVLQTLAKNKLLPKIDYLSTVSGGGYIGSFLGMLFSRTTLPHSCPTENCTRHEAINQTLNNNQGETISWLRENGRYLTPNGSSDSILAVAIALRNWLSVLLVMATCVIMVSLLLQIIELSVLRFIPSLVPFWQHEFWFGDWLWLSPWSIIPALMFSLLVIPLGTAYWLWPAQRRWPNLAVWTNVVIVLQALICWLLYGLMPGYFSAVGYAIPLISLMGVNSGLAIIYGAWIYRDNTTSGSFRRGISSALSLALLWTCVALACALVDSVGRTLYTVWAAANENSGLTMYVSGVATGLLALFAAIQKFMGVLMPKAKDKNAGAQSLVAGLGLIAVGLIFVLLSCINALGHGLSWSFQRPVLPETVPFLPQAEKVTGELLVEGKAVQVAIPTPTPKKENTPLPFGKISPTPALCAWVIALFSTLSFALIISFINNSSLASIYAARLTRSYLGASNPRRQNATRAKERHGETISNPITALVPGDDQFYYPTNDQQEHYAPHRNGGPLHLINVTINETMDNRSHLQHIDRKGVGMAFGPAGLSVGVQHHAELIPTQSCRDLSVHGIPKAGYHVFPLQDIACEHLSVGQMVGISGAAFSTGIGSRTSFALSLLCGLLNVRTGYWWNSGTHKRRTCLSYEFLFYEWLARFPGTGAPYWYLSDGGHFENLACYELIRRQLPIIICLDNGEDPKLEYEDLGSLTRKARLDFNCDIRFFSRQEMQNYLGQDSIAPFGTLDEMRPQRDDDGIITTFPTACASIAELIYEKDSSGNVSKNGIFIFIKPTVLGHESEDIRYYQRSHASFPHEPTIDQFFDEAQWESYRKLGETQAQAVFEILGKHLAEKC
jgi:Patatin-like phospholipase